MNIKDDSRKVVNGDIFVALRKENDGHKYINDAIKNGASKVIVEYGDYSVETKKVADTHKYLVDYLYDNYYKLIKELKLIGVTGTNGKTTTCYLIYQALNKLGIKCAYIGTIGFYLDKKIRSLNNTTPDILQLYELLLECVDNDIEYVVMECSSHALDMHRLDKLEFQYGIFTNLTEEHLDYHKNITNYINAKKKLFDQVVLKTFVNIDDKYCNYFIRDNSITYGLNGDYRLSDINLVKKQFKVNDVLYKTKLIGKHNIYNLLTVISLLSELNMDTKVIEDLSCPPGRMDIVNKDDNIIVIDYAHTPDAVSKILDSVKELNFKKIITIMGCGGDRDRFKRPIMSEIVCNNSNYVIFTNDNPRWENPNNIISDMLHNLDKFNYEIILNREKAIEKGIQMLEKNDILLVLGKGHENYQTIKGVKYHFDDKEIVLKKI